jgi:ABC-type multidrug transport system fused ATPase/permease subunit
MVRIRLPPAESLSLGRIHFRRSSPGFPRGCARLAWRARALLKDAPIVVLDEANSALDTAVEIEIQRALDALMRGRTVLAIAHRLSTVAKFDRLVVLQDGRIIEDGPPAELRRRRGLFDRMCRLQEGEPLRLAS